jgi:DNA polymerase-1
MRHKAKAVNFGLIYGQGAFGLSQELSISQQEATQFIKKYFQRYPNVKNFLESCKEEARQTGIVTTMTGRQRPVPEIKSPNALIRAQAERFAVNTPFQGAQADIIKMAMIEVQKEIAAAGCNGYMILQIHDELIFEVLDRDLPLLQEIVKNKMETIVSLKVPLIVDISIGKNWGEC